MAEPVRHPKPVLKAARLPGRLVPPQFRRCLPHAERGVLAAPVGVKDHARRRVASGQDVSKGVGRQLGAQAVGQLVADPLDLDY